MYAVFSTVSNLVTLISFAAEMRPSWLGETISIVSLLSAKGIDGPLQVLDISRATLIIALEDFCRVTLTVDVIVAVACRQLLNMARIGAFRATF